jgi:hypothetical protein
MKDCFQAIKAEMPDIPDRVIKKFVEDMRGKKGSEDDFRKAAYTFIKEVELQTMREVVAKKYQIMAKRRIRGHFDQFKEAAKAGNLAEAFKSLLVGTREQVKNARVSAERISKTQGNFWNDTLDYGMSKIEPTLLKRLAMGEHNADLMKELWHMENVDTAVMQTGNKEAFEAAKVIRGVMKDVPVMFRRVGVDMGYIKNYLPQSHNRERIKAAGFDKWATDINKMFDMEKAFGKEIMGNNKKLRAALQGAYDDIVMGRDRADHLAGTSDKFVTWHDVTNEGAKLSKKRTFHAMSAEGHVEYNKLYGDEKPFINDIDMYLRKRARAYGLISTFGPNPEATFQTLLGNTRGGKGEFEKHMGMDLTNNQKRLLQAQYDELSGRSLRTPEDFYGKFAVNANIIQDMSKLGMAVFSQGTDLPISVGVVSSKSGVGPIPTLHKAFNLFLANLKPTNRDRILRNIHIGLAGEHISDFSRFSETADVSRFDQAQSGLKKAHNWFFKLNGMDIQTKDSRATVAAMFSSNLREEADLKFDALEPETRATLEQAGINHAEWEAIRQARTEVPGSFGATHEVLLPDMLKDVDEAKMVELHKQSGDKGTMESWRQETYMKFAGMLGDIAETGAPNPGVRQAAMTKWGFGPDTAMGASLAMLMKYKGIQLAVYDSMMAIKSSDPSKPAHKLLSMDGNNKALAATVVSMWAAGFGINMVRNAVAGRDQPDPTSSKDLMEAFVRGGAGIFYGDYMMTDYSGNYRDWARDIVGPVFSEAAQLNEIRSKTMHAILGTDKRYHFGPGKRGGQGVESDMWDLARRNMPLNNLFYTKYAFDKLVDDNMKNYLAPGYTKRRDARILKEKLKKK